MAATCVALAALLATAHVSPPPPPPPPPPPQSCSEYIQTAVCKNTTSPVAFGCVGGCLGQPHKCLGCAFNMQNHMFLEVRIHCPDGRPEIEAACNVSAHRRPTAAIAVTGGAVRGFVQGNQSHTTFRGIPFAAPPTADRRWRPPQPVTPWSGVRDATAFGPTCLQRGPAWHSIDGVPNSSEDCLYLNVYAPVAGMPPATAGGGGQGGGPLLAATAAVPPPSPRDGVLSCRPVYVGLWKRHGKLRGPRGPARAGGWCACRRRGVRAGGQQRDRRHGKLPARGAGLPGAGRASATVAVQLDRELRHPG